MAEICRICLDSANPNQLISPCACKGTQQYVHRDCLLNWQETAMDTFLTSPSKPSFANFNVCNICKTPYNLNSSYRKLLYLSPHVDYLLTKYKTHLYIFILLTIILLFFIPLFLMIFFYITTGLFLCYHNNMRPQLNNTCKGYRLGLIMVGKPVSGLSPGTIIEASPKISKGIFAGSKILLTEYSIQKATGFILNKGMKIANKEIKFGGPVNISKENVLHNDPSAEGCQFIVNGLYAGGRVDEGKQGVRVLKVNGHAGWKSLQLDGEIAAGSWILRNVARFEDVFLE